MKERINYLFMLNQSAVYVKCNKLFVDVMTFGEWLRQKIIEMNVSNAEVARRAKVSPTYIGNLVRDYSPNTKNGKVKPSLDVVDAIAKAVGSSVNEARLAAGYASDSSTDDFEVFDGITISFQDSVSPEKQKELLDAMRLVARGAFAENQSKN